MAYTDEFALAMDPVFVSRVRMSMINAATQIQSESPQTTDHANRAQLALAAIRDSATFANIFAFTIVTQPGITSGSTDAAIDTAVATVWNAVAAPQL